MGPMNRTLSISPDVNDPAFRGMTFDQAREAYEEQVRGLIDGGADLLLLETIFDTLNAKAAIVAIENVFEEKGVRLPLMISVTITDRSGRTLSGQTLDAFYVSIRHARPFSVGINCALGARDMRPYIAELARDGRVLRQRLSERRPAQRVRPVRRAARRDRRAAARLRRQRLRQHHRRLLRDDAGSHRGGAQGGRGAGAAGAAGRFVAGSSPTARSSDIEAPARTATIALLPVLRPRDADHPARQQLPDDRRAHQRHRLGEVRPPDQERQLRRSGARGGGAGARRRQPDRRQHGRRHARLRAGHDDVPELHRHRARDRPRAGDGRQLEVVGDRGRPEVRAGQGRRQLDQPEGRRSRLPAQGAS